MERGRGMKGRSKSDRRAAAAARDVAFGYEVRLARVSGQARREQTMRVVGKRVDVRRWIFGQKVVAKILSMVPFAYRDHVRNRCPKFGKTAALEALLKAAEAWEAFFPGSEMETVDGQVPLAKAISRLKGEFGNKRAELEDRRRIRKGELPKWLA